MAATARRERLEALQRLCDEGQSAELQSVISSYSTKELRTLCGGFGVPAQSKEYAAYQSKAGYAELLLKLLEAKTASAAGLTGGGGFMSLTTNPSGRTRKSKNCNLRLINVLFSSFMAPFLRELGDEGARRKRNADGSSPFWEKVRAEFVSTKVEYARVAYPDDEVFVDYNLGSPIAHSSEKLRKMWEKLGLAYVCIFGSQFATAGDNAEDLSACTGRHDVYYLRRWLNDKPELIPIVCKAPVETDIGHSVSPSGFQRVEDLQQQATQQNFQSSFQQSSVGRIDSPVVSVDSGNVRSTNDEGERLMKSIKLAYDVLAVMPVTDHGSEIEHTIRRRLQRCAKRLKMIEDEEEKQSMSL
ncbi:hypothetical protein PR003_g237 [Phytophthora rubi]|uniref:Uncharacterized protein n=1 Tax=Phytophthora rubi TaxID=129364 RepID=A0A6A4G9G2_9STRA|nr:hypothetical protein PR003_g237 [Phytophthora rubi]